MKKFKLRCHQLIAFIKYCYYCIYCKIHKIHNEDKWIISERGDDARDNGYAFYKYMVANHPEVDFKYVIKKGSQDERRIEKKRLIYQGSKEHYILFITAGYLLSTHIMGYSPEFRLFNKLDKLGLIHINGRRIYLNHGIENQNVDGLKCGKIKVDLFVCGAKPQYDHELKVLGHPDGVLQYTGMPRYDYLKNNLKNQILFMPTWRTWLFYCKNPEEFKKSEYFINWNKLINDEKLRELLEKNNLELVFYPHYEIQPYLKAFEFNNNNRIKIASIEKYDVQTLLNESRILVSDYSSVIFDFAFLNKPVIYFQFDYDNFFKFHYGKGYYSYDKDGFGPVSQTVDQTINLIEQYLENNFAVEGKYANNKKRFFTLDENGNSERVYRKILECKKNYI